MRILYTILNPYGLGADKWIYEGYREAFLSEGHEVFSLTEQDDFETLAMEARPDLFILDFAALERYCREVKQVSPDFFQALKSHGTKIFCLTDAGADREAGNPQKTAFFKKYLSVFDVFYSNYAPEAMHDFERTFEKKLSFIPHAANSKYYFPEKPDDKFQCDIAFVGSYYTQKKDQFERLLFPLFKKYRVCLYGPGWTKKDRILRLGSGLARRGRIGWLTRWINGQRITLSVDDERKLYASAKICVNIHEYYHSGDTKGFSNEREFKIPASGGFQFSDYIPGMERYYELNREIAVVKTPAEWFSRIDYYLKNAKERREIQEKGTARVLREHTYRHRVKQMMDLYNSIT